MHPIELDTTREPQMFEVEVQHAVRRRGIDSYREPGTVVRSTNVRVTVPVVPSETIREIWKHNLAPNTFSLVVYPEYEYDDVAGTVHTVVGPEAAQVRHAIEQIRTAVTRYNSSIESENEQLRQKIVPIVTSKVDRVEDKHSKLDTLAATVGIPLIKRTDISKVVPTVPGRRNVLNRSSGLSAGHHQPGQQVV